MGWLMPLGAVLTVVGLAGSVGACYQGDQFEQIGGAQARSGSTPAEAAAPDSSMPMVAAGLSGLLMASGVLCLGIGVGHWRRPVPSGVRPANPWSDQPGEHGDKTGLV